MELEERVAELERRLAVLEQREGHEHPQVGSEGDFWALEGFKEQLAAAHAADGGVLFTGAVRLPTNERYEWQYGTLTESLLAEDWNRAADSFAALGHPVRLRLLREILGGRRTAAELTELEGLGTTGQIYHHLRLLTAAGWLHTASRGRYEVPPVRVVPLLVALTTALP
ncbi:ArsR/SmtB family transcription factor [Streptomyces albipurpureus]|uniref:Helix-turn-helix domain-containing protein n=1 Tax=Streptomyces albipurpureus TaxID=2897419 RepID=A0ABT0URH4_9ACTN|nr:helix-turn-helix domain-containing protein [Streptomyces sp. CWNU-1]MCM2390947.1 helix-turn-helix domain-containing protein [Streptomyces sp. CWNU-1]